MKLYTPTPRVKRKSTDHEAQEQDALAQQAEQAIQAIQAIRSGSLTPVEGVIEWHHDAPRRGEKRANGERATLHITRDGRTHEYKLAIVTSGGANYALSTSARDIMIRLARYPVRPDENGLRDHEEEVKITRELADRGICPAIFLDIRIHEKGYGDVYPATAIERMDYSLSDVQKCPVLMRKMFVDADGESALVDLYAQASHVVRCTDTKASNVVVNLYDDDTPPRIALIDVDTVHCWRLEPPQHPEATEQLPPFGRDQVQQPPIEALRSYLSGVDMSADSIPLTPMLTLTLSLLVHVTVAAGDYVANREEFGFPYPRITRVLIEHWGIVTELVREDHEAAEAALLILEHKDARYGVLPRLGDRTVLTEIQHYCAEKAENPVCTWRNLDVFLKDTMRLPESAVLEVCAMSREAGAPRLYELLVTMLGTKRFPYHVYKEKMGKKPASVDALRRLAGLAGKHAPQSAGRYVIPARCNLRSCKYHRDPRTLVY